MSLEERAQSAGPTPERPHARVNVGQMLLVGAIASALGIALGLLIDWFPVAASEEAGPIDTLWDVLLIASIPVFVLVTTVVLFAVLKFRMRPGEENLDGPPIHGNTRLEVIWTAIPAILLVGLCTYSFVVLEDVEALERDRIEVRVVGEQFAWTYYYDRDGEEVASRQLVLPIDRQVRFTLQSKDVIHDFWVPAFRIKKDAVPGIDVTYSVTPNRLGTFPVVCAELCGLGHAVMRSQARVVEQQEFESWLAEVGQPAQDEEGGDEGGGGGGEADPKALFASEGCGGCHTLADAGTTGTTGPDLDDVLQGKDEAFIRQAIVEPDAEIAEGYQGGIMPPNYEETIPGPQLDALVQYLSEVTQGG